MDSFAKWLVDQDSATNPNLASLQTIAKDPASKWPYWSNRLSDYLKALDSINPAPANISDLRNALADAFERWTKSRQAGKKTLLALVFENLTTLLVGFVGLVLLAAVVYGLWNSEFYASLAKPEQGRGVLTFFVAVTAMVVILLISIAIFAFANTDDLVRRIASAKDVLTVVVGILGTIMGFYFGSATESRSALAISAVELASAEVTAGDPVELKAKISGGDAPYTISIAANAAGVSYTLVPAKPSGPDVKETVPTAHKDVSGNVKVIVTVKDNKGVSKEASQNLVVKPKPK